ncbi:MAG TPA: M20/M25/M40 family metallo-hydrolase [Gemmatimonadaceae bacterium]|nr:M20/M25/M40 family metallo-hydrolase [Gemmatimonadaceae bacterium]
MPDARMGLVRDVQVAAALADISPARIRHTDSALVAFGTRNTFSDTLSTVRGIGAARRWIYNELRTYSRDCGGCLRVEYDAAEMALARANGQRVNVVNVLAWLPGRDTTRVIVMGGHYDSCVCGVPLNGGIGGGNDGISDAPGADDDGSGTSAVIELARVASMRYPKGLDATIIFALYASEEQGTNGSRHLAERLRDGGYRIIAGMTDDIVGNVVAEDGAVDSTSVRIYAADSVPSGGGELARYVWALGQTYLRGFEVRPTFRLDRLGRGGDHGPFYRIGVPALRFTERLENYRRQHLPTDDFKNVNFPYTANIARLNLAAVLSLAAAPAAPDSALQRRENTSSGGQKWTLAWHPVPGAASYEVLVRSTWSPVYTRLIPVQGTTYVVDEQLDDAWAAVRTVGVGGWRSLTTVFTVPTRSPRSATTTPPPNTP